MKLNRKVVALALVVTFSGVAAAGIFDFFKKKEPEANPAKPAAAASVPKKAQKSISYEKDIKPILEEYCYDCHSDGTKKGGIALDEHTDLSEMLKDRKLWSTVTQNVEQRLMPPEKKAQPTHEQRDLIAEWVKQDVFKTDPNNPDPGRVTIRRLNREEYNNTIRDLVGVNFDPAEGFPADDSGYGFDNIGDVLSLSPIMLEKYMNAAQKILDQAVVVGLPKPPTMNYGASRIAGGTPLGNEARILVSNGEMFFNHNFQADGEYAIIVKAFGNQGGPQPVKMAIRLGGKDLKQVDVRESADNPGTFEVKFTAKAGEARVAVAFLNDFYQAEDKKRKKRKIDTNLIVKEVDVAGPIDAANPIYPETHTRIFTKKPTGEGDRQQVAREIIQKFADRAYRRPITEDELNRLMAIYALGEKNKEPFEMSVKLALQAVLVSPRFLFRGEIQAEPDNPQKAQPINEYALASRLSYFLWSSMPDTELFDYARRGVLRQNLAFQVQRMLRDNKAKALVENFAGQWLMLRNLDIVSPDPKTYPDWDESLKGLMRKETEMFFEYIMREDRSLFDFLTADYTFVNERLAQHYNLGGVVGDKFQKVSLAGTQRSGVLTQGSILTITSNPTRTSPVKRGLWVLENLLATPPPPPPPDVPPLDDNKEAATGSLRERLEKHRNSPVCASCHARMDPLGFGLENFDGIGSWREKDEGYKIDPTGKLVTGESFAGPNELNHILAKDKQEEFLHCMAEKMLIYALGRGLEWYDKPTLEQISTEVKAGNNKFSALVMAVVKSVPFQLRRGDGER
jgi:mono/diheme cytochrome c family protein